MGMLTEDEIAERNIFMRTVREEIRKQFQFMELDFSDLRNDIGDLGNEIGIVIGRLDEDAVEDFIGGLKHGLSLSDGTHLTDNETNLIYKRGKK